MTSLPHEDGRLFLTDAGLETVLIFHEGIDLPYFAAFDLLKDEAGTEVLRGYFDRFAALARDNKVGFVLESPTWRASPDWGDKLGYSAEALAAANRRSIDLIRKVQASYETPESPMVVSGNLGPRGDGYDPGTIMTPEDAEAYHAAQIGAFAEVGVDVITALTMNNTNEAIGVTRAARAAGLPVVISFTVETDGRLPTGDSLQEAVAAVEEATDRAPAYYMINCAHPTHFATVLKDAGQWATRIRGLRANASKQSHAELDEAEVLDDGDPHELGAEYAGLLRLQGQINVVGGCCGTDYRHVEQILEACRR